jgi:hypothetical protein
MNQEIQLQLQYLARQSRATHKEARGSWGRQAGDSEGRRADRQAGRKAGRQTACKD